MSETEIITNPFRLSFGDYARFMIVTHVRNLVRWPSAALYGALVVGLPLLIHIPSLPQGRYGSLAFMMGVMALLWLVLVPVISLAGAWWNFRRNALARSIRSARVTARSFVLEGPGLHSELTWNNFSEARRGWGGIYLYLTQGTGHIIPDATFDTPQAAISFLERAKTLVAQSRHSQAAAFESPVTPAPVQVDLQSQPYLYTFDLHFRLYTGLYYRSLWRVLLAGLAVVYAILLWRNDWGLTESARTELLPQLLGFTVFMVVAISVLPLILAPVSWLLGRRHASVGGTRTACLVADRVVIHGHSFHTELKLSDLRQIRRTRHLILFVVQPGSAVPVPVSAFETPEAAQAFFDEAQARWRAARPAAKTHLDGKS